eukprot:TRINITY_DN28357_c0_g1_i2.p1 TRINITY_DN28357_c0_g1~~TRINITY_DN28357_c0_g1_i2.p1  ORF type:complete len:100 (+),score=11.72 TRINITY_DN28357_c0_g1_i2:1709-2008(+)
MIEWPKPNTLKAPTRLPRVNWVLPKDYSGYGKLAGPLTSRLKKDTFLWTLEAEKALEQLKHAMTDGGNFKAPIHVVRTHQGRCPEPPSSHTPSSAIPRR